jgi:hypothetical protein
MSLPQLQLGEYEHYKGGRYRVLSLAKHSETLEDMVVYEALYDVGQIWVRPLAMFIEQVEVNGIMVPRFKYLG